MSQLSTKKIQPFKFTGRLVVHVGTHKTGSTSIQSYCMENYDSLLDAGCLYPQSGRKNERGVLVINHHPLMRSTIGESTRSLESQLKEFGDEIELTKPHVIVISSEILSREYLSAEPFEVIKTLFPLAEREWVIFLRQQADVLTSRYAEMIKTRKITWPHGIEMINSPLYLDHRLRLEKLRYAVADDRITVLSFDAEKKRLLEAFFETCRLGVPDSSNAYYRNTSLPWGALNLLRFTNCFPTFLQRYIRGFVTLVAGKLVKSPASFLVSWGRPLSKSERDQVKKSYCNSNRWVEKEYLGGQPLLHQDSSTIVPK